jgi:hypothetical protein
MRIPIRPFLWSGLAALILAIPASAKLEIVNIKAVYGPLGPERPDQNKLEVYPGEELFFKYAATGVAIDEKGNFKGNVRVKIIDSDGKAVSDQPSRIQGLLALGGATLQGTARIAFAPTAAKGKYKVVVSITDTLREESAEFQREVNLKATEFAVVNPRFFYDKENKIPAPAGGQVNQTLFFRTQVIGFDKSDKKIRTKMSLQFLDKKGKEIMPQPVTALVATDKEDQVAMATVLTFNGNISMNRAGEFTMRMVFTDEIAKKEVKFETVLNVHE